MIIVMDRDLCDANLPFCARCSAAFFQKPQGTDRLCITDVIDDGNENELEIVVHTDDRVLQFQLTDEIQEIAAVEGWEFLADFSPALLRTGAAQRWREIGKLPRDN